LTVQARVWPADDENPRFMADNSGTGMPASQPLMLVTAPRATARIAR
jgi:hypothetical protein